MRPRVRLCDVGPDGDPARVGVLDDRHRRLVEVGGRAPGGVGVDVVVVRHRLAVQLLGLREPGRAVLAHVQRGRLVRVLAVPQHVGAAPGGAGPAGELLAVGGDGAAHPRRHRDVVGACVNECLGGGPPPLLESEHSRTNRVNDIAIPSR